MSSYLESWIRRLETKVDRLMAYEAQSIKYGVVTASSALNLTTGYSDIPGVTLTFTPLTAENIHVSAVCYLSQPSGTAACNAGDTISMNLLLDGATKTFGTNNDLTILAIGATGVLVWCGWAIITTGVTAGSSHTLKCQAKNATGARGQINTMTHFYYKRMAQ